MTIEFAAVTMRRARRMAASRSHVQRPVAVARVTNALALHRMGCQEILLGDTIGCIENGVDELPPEFRFSGDGVQGRVRLEQGMQLKIAKQAYTGTGRQARAGTLGFTSPAKVCKEWVSTYHKQQAALVDAKQRDTHDFEIVIAASHSICDLLSASHHELAQTRAAVKCGFVVLHRLSPSREIRQC
jgi:hypothetical protein